jgi:hypothetical protein
VIRREHLEEENPRGVRVGKTPKSRLPVTDSRTEQGPAGEGRGLAPTGNRRQEIGLNDKRARRCRKMLPAVRGEQTPEGKPWTWLWGEIDPQGKKRIKPSET